MVKLGPSFFACIVKELLSVSTSLVSGWDREEVEREQVTTKLVLFKTKDTTSDEELSRRWRKSFLLDPLIASRPNG